MSLPISRVIRLQVALLMAVTVAGCTDAQTLGVPPGLRPLVVTVDNRSPLSVRLVVAQDGPRMGPVVGSVSTGEVPPGATVEVTFGVPPGGLWAIFVNPGAGMGPLVAASDVPADASGKMPFEIIVRADGTPSARVAPDLPGWFGN